MTVGLPHSPGVETRLGKTPGVRSGTLVLFCIAVMNTTPELLAKVSLNRRGEVYLVVDVDYNRKVVELLSITGAQYLVPDVPIASIDELVEGPPDYL